MNMYVSSCLYTYACTVCMHVRACVRAYVRVFVCVHVYVCRYFVNYIGVNACIYNIFILFKLLLKHFF